MADRPRIVSIPAGVPFLPTLADALLAGGLVPLPRGDPLALADVTILLPTRRAARALGEILAERLGGAAAILPSIRPIGDVDEEDHLLAPAVEGAGAGLILPPAISRLDRQLILANLILAWGRAVRRDLLVLEPNEGLLIPASAADATRLAADLARLIDDMEMAGIPWEAIRNLAPDDHTRYFQITLDFLKIAMQFWPERLKELQRSDPVVRRDQLIRAEAKRLASGAPGPVIAAGSTGSVPATAELLKAIADLDNGAVVLPGLDTEIDDAGWAAVENPDNPKAAAFGHPQHFLKLLLERIGIVRGDVATLGTAAAPIAARARLLSEALRPAETTESWSRFRAREIRADVVEAALAGVGLIVARNEQEEALAIALAFREALEEGVASAALVTPDRTLARRVAVELCRWGLAIDDSAGTPLDRLPPGILARLLAEAAYSRADPAKLLALLKHPLAAFGMDRARCRRAARALELALFRGHRVAGGVAALPAAVAASLAQVESKAPHLAPARRRLGAADWRLAGEIAATLAETLGPLEAAFAGGDTSAAAATELLREALAEAARDETGGDALLWQGPAGEALAELLDGLAESHGRGLGMSGAEYPSFLGALMGEVRVARAFGLDPRIQIWGTLEARLQSVDLLILGGLDESIWPAATRTDPWLSRAMRAEIGLAPPERRTGQAAHDFAQGMAAPRVLVSRAEKRGGTPTVASRWLQRLLALVGTGPAERLRASGDRLVHLARSLDRVEAGDVRAMRRPAPTPPVAVRPRRLSVTEIETLVRDPYATYAKHVLGLTPLDPLGRAPDYAMRGTIVHEALGSFIGEWTGAFDGVGEARLVEIGETLLAAIADFPDVRALWSIRFRAIARWFIAWEAGRSADVAARHAEQDGKLALDMPGGPFELRGRADRVDLLRSGDVAIFDFKTGTPQTDRTVFAGLTPQMTLEAAMVRAGAFGAELAGKTVAELAWLSLGKVVRGEPYISAVRANKGETADGLADRALAMLKGLIAAFDVEATAYISRARPMSERQPYRGEYDHLARVREWALLETEEDIAIRGGTP